jgi:hypothetical protein
MGSSLPEFVLPSVSSSGRKPTFVFKILSETFADTGSLLRRGVRSQAFEQARVRVNLPAI